MFLWLNRLDQHFPIRYSAWALCFVGLLASAFAWAKMGMDAWLAIVFLGLVLLGVRDVRQKRHAVLRNYPVIGHLRFLLEFIRPEMRQYFIESDSEAAPFSRQQRSLVYQRAKGDSDKRPFGTQLNVGAIGYEWINHSMQPTVLETHDFRVVIGADRAQPYSASLFNISAMSFGALSANAILALNAGAKHGNFAHDTGEGSISRHHRVHGGDLIWEIGSGYFGCCGDDGSFSEERFAKNARDPQVKMIELKLSQGAKPGHGGVLPGPKVTIEIAEARSVQPWVDCVSPASHAAFTTPIEMMKFIDRLRELSGGKPTGFKLCIGHPWEWFSIAKAMHETGILPDFIVVDGAEGGTGAAPLEFCDHVGAPLQEGLLLVHNTLVGLNLRDRIKLGCAGKVVSAFDIARMLALGADWCNAARGFMFALGCIQAQTCHTGACPTGVTTQDPQRQKALDVTNKADRVYHFHQNTLLALKELVQAAGLHTPAGITADHIVRRTSDHGVKLLANLLPFVQPGELLRDELTLQVFRTYWPMASAASFSATPVAPPSPPAVILSEAKDLAVASR
jgi:glutamate synthase domain-containing protein 2